MPLLPELKNVLEFVSTEIPPLTGLGGGDRNSKVIWTEMESKQAAEIESAIAEFEKLAARRLWLVVFPAATSISRLAKGDWRLLTFCWYAQ
jgi:hypothetical protein